MFSYDSVLLAAVQTPPQSVEDVLRIMHAIDSVCIDGDGLKWFNWMYLEVTGAVDGRVRAGGFTDPEWMARLDVVFARFYFDALTQWLTAGSAPDCWQVLFERREQTATARIQFALAGINAHINHDLPQAIVAAIQSDGAALQYGGVHYNDYTALNSTLESMIDTAKRTLGVRLLGDPLPPVSRLEDTIAAWSVTAAREAAWKNARLLFHLSPAPALKTALMENIGGLTALAGKALLVPVL
ncbi:MAG TPA: DUF5995 family protein [Bryobacteraceae bacterium]|jgi:hypothetical protein|nr:DUF5995 family protein [Bryobacteraceae bacterium]